MNDMEKIKKGIEARIRLGIVETTYETADGVLKFLADEGFGIGEEIEIPAGYFYIVSDSGFHQVSEADKLVKFTSLKEMKDVKRN